MAREPEAATGSQDPLRRPLEDYARTGDEAAMAEVVAATRPLLLRVAARICPEQDAEDCVQAAYCSLVRKGALPEGAPVRAWLLTTVIRIAYRRKAVLRRDEGLAAVLAPRERHPSPPSAAEQAELERLIWREVEQLPETYRDPVVLYHLHGLQVAEAARLLGLSETALAVRLHRGRQLLRSRLSVRLARTVLLLPWLLADGARAAGGLTSAAWLGVVMKAKILVVAGCLLLAAGGTYLALRPAGGPSGPAADRPGTTEVASNPTEARESPGSEPPAPAEVAAPAPEGEEAAETTGDHSSSVCGTVVDESGTPLAGARVTVRVRGESATSPDSSQRVETGPDGRFEATELPAGGLATVDVDLPGYAWEARRAQPPIVVGGEDLWIVLAARAMVSGIVLDAGRKPVAKAHVWATRLEPDGTPAAGSGLPDRYRTDEQGRFACSPLSAGSYRIRALHPEVGSGLAQVELGEAERHEGVEIVLEAGLPLAGRVVDQHDSPLAEASVWVRPCVTPGPGRRPAELDFSLRTDAAGRFRVAGLPAGPYWVSVMHPDCADVYATPNRGGPEVHQAGETDVTLVLRRGVAVSGIVVDDSGAPVFNAVVQYGPAGAQRWNLNARATTHRDGTFRISGLPPDTVELIASSRAHLLGEVQQLDLRPGADVEGLRLVLPSGLTLTGRVVDDAGVPVAGVTVAGRLASLTEGRSPARTDIFGDPQLRFGRSDATGAFTMPGLQPGASYRLEVSGGGSHLTPETDTEANVYPAGAEGVTLVVRRGATLKGSVSTPEDTPLAEAQIELVALPARGDAPGARGVTHVDGLFLIRNIPEGRWQVRCRAYGYQEMEPVEVELAAGEEVSLHLKLARGGEITGRVCTPEGEPIAGVQIFARGTGQGGAVMTDSQHGGTGEDGRFRMAGLGEGTYRVSIQKMGHKRPPDQPSPVYARAGEVLELRLLPPGVILGRVVDDRGQPVAEFTVQALLVRPAYRRQTLVDEVTQEQAFTAPEGRFRLELTGWRTPEAIRVTARGLAPQRRELPGPVESGEVDAGTLVLAPGAAVSGVVLAPDGSPASQAQVNGTQVEGEVARPRGPEGTSTDAEGRFRLEDLGPGSHRIQATHPRWGPGETLADVPVSGEVTGLTLRLTEGGTLAGRVLGPEGAGLPLARIEATSTRRGEGGWYACAVEGTTDAEGRYRLVGLAEGTYVVVATLRGEAFDRRLQGRAVVHQGRETVCDLGAEVWCRLSGRIAGLPPEQPGRRNAVSLRSTDSAGLGGRSTTRTFVTGDGQYSLAPMPPGEYLLEITAAFAVPVTLPPRRELRLDLQLPTGALQGVVVSSEGQPVVGAEVSLIPQDPDSSSTRPIQTPSGPDGSFTFGSLPEGSYLLEAAKAGLGRATAGPVAVAGGSGAGPVRLEIPPGSPLEISVVDAEGSPVRTVRVTVEDALGLSCLGPGGLQWIAPGVWRTGPLGPGAYRVAAGSPGLGSSWADLQVEAGEPTEAARVTLGGAGSRLQVRVTAGGAPAEGARVELADEGGRTVQDLSTYGSSFTGADGAVTTGLLPPGRYTVRASLAGSMREAAVDLPPDGGVTPVVLSF